MFFFFQNYLGHFLFCQHTTLTVGKESSQFKTKCNAYTYFKVKTVNPCKDLRITAYQKEGDPNIYVSKDPERFPTLSRMVWSSNDPGI